MTYIHYVRKMTYQNNKPKKQTHFKLTKRTHSTEYQNKIKWLAFNTNPPIKPSILYIVQYYTYRHIYQYS